MASVPANTQTNQHPIRVVWYHSEFPFGGAETVTLTIAKTLTERYSTIHPIILTSNQRAELSGIEIHTLNDLSLTPRNPTGRKAIIDKLRELQTDIYVQTQDPEIGWLTELRRSMPELIIVYHLHSFPFWQVKHKISGRFFKRLKEKLFHTYTKRYLKRYTADYQASNHWITLCDKYTATLQNILGPNVSTMYNPIELDKYTGLRTHRKNKEVLCMSRLTRHDKRIDRLLRAWSMVQSDFPDWELKIVGSGNDEAALKEIAQNLKLKNIKFCGHSNSPTEHYATASILCLTSNIEGWGLVIIEALASGVRPLVMNCSDGLSEIIENTHIESVASGDVKAFAMRLRDMMKSSAEIPPLPDFVQNLDTQIITNKWAVFLENLAHQKFGCNEFSS